MDILKNLNYYPDEVIIVSEQQGNQPIPVDFVFDSDDSITIIPVASGG
jgi:sulfur carrier protein ThiS